MEPLLEDRSDLRLAHTLHELSAFFNGRADVQLADHLSDWNIVLTTNILGHMLEPQLTFTFIENNVTTDIAAPMEGGSLHALHERLTF
jgi:hypothetical protein